MPQHFGQTSVAYVLRLPVFAYMFTCKTLAVWQSNKLCIQYLNENNLFFANYIFFRNYNKNQNYN